MTVAPEFRLRERIIVALVKRKMREVLGSVAQETKDFLKAEFSEETERRNAGLIVLAAMERASAEILAEYRKRAERS